MEDSLFSTNLEFIQKRSNFMDADRISLHKINIRGETAHEELIDGLRNFGLVLIEGVSHPNQLVKLAKKLGAVVRHPDSPHSLGTILRNLKKPTDDRVGFTNLSMGLHNDRSSEKNPPDLLFFFVQKMGVRGGTSLFCDGKQVLRYLQNSHPEIVSQLKNKKALCIQDKKGAAFYPVLAKMSHNHGIRFRYDSKSFYNSRMIEVLPLFFKTLQKLIFHVHLQQGEGYILNNGRWLHGRTAFFGKRVVYRLLIKTSKKLRNKGIVYGFKL